ncbi:MAG TPA: hypothetical protein VM096_10530 [Vicinamibacterales bacterium]|nr:hypothetical protein [Vicinamibacterales bacterium]
MQATLSPSFPAPCPQCDAGAGMPFKAGTSPHYTTIEVSMRCRECGHEWVIQIIPSVAAGRASISAAPAL